MRSPNIGIQATLKKHESELIQLLEEELPKTVHNLINYDNKEYSILMQEGKIHVPVESR